jgi:hypothetical protein
MSAHFRLAGDGVEVRLGSEEVFLLGEVTRLLVGLGDPASDPGAARLSPPVYLDDPEADAEWRRLAGSELDQARRADRSAVETILETLRSEPGSVTVSIPEANAMMRVFNDARLALGARWGIDEPEDYEKLRPEAEEVLSFLGWVVSELAIVLGGALQQGR